MKHVEIRVDQEIGSGQGYFFEQNAPGVDALVELKNESRHAVLRLVITRFHEGTVQYDVRPHQELAVEVRHIQTVGILALPRVHDGKQHDGHGHDDGRRSSGGRRHDNRGDKGRSKHGKHGKHSKHDKHDKHDGHDGHDGHDKHRKDARGRLVIIPNFGSINLP